MSRNSRDCGLTPPNLSSSGRSKRASLACGSLGASLLGGGSSRTLGITVARRKRRALKC
jgi:hypothetical protein